MHSCGIDPANFLNWRLACLLEWSPSWLPEPEAIHRFQPSAPNFTTLPPPLTLATAALWSPRGAPDLQSGGPGSGSGSEDDGGLGAEQAGDGQRQGDAAGAGRPAPGRVRARALRAPDPHLGAQRHRHLPHHLWRLRVWHVPGRPGEQGPPVSAHSAHFGDCLLHRAYH